MSQYLFPSFLFVKDNIEKAIETLSNDVETELDDFIVFNECNRIMISNDDITKKILKQLVIQSCFDFVNEFWRSVKHSQLESSYNIDKKKDNLVNKFWNKVADMN